MRDLASRHGPLMLLRLGGLRVVVASSADAAREVMRSRDLNFATRSMSRTVRMAFPRGTEGIIFAPYGAGWRQMRKVCTVELLSARRVQSFRPVRAEEAGRLLRAVAAAAAASPPARAVNLSELITVYAADSAVRTIIGSSFKDRDAFLTLLERMVKMVAKMSLPDLYPSSRLAMLVSRMPGKMKRQRQELVAFIDDIVREHEENRAAGNDGKEDLLDVLLRIQREGDLHVPITTDNIKSVVVDFVGEPMDQGVLAKKGTCAIIACAVALVAKHRLEYEILHGKGTFKWKAAAPDDLLKECEEESIWISGEGADVGKVLTQIRRRGGVTATTTNGATCLLPLHLWQKYTWHAPDYKASLSSPECVAKLLDSHGPCVGVLRVCQSYFKVDAGREDAPQVYREFRHDMLVGLHAIVCVAYRVVHGRMHVLVRDNHDAAAKGPMRWIAVELILIFYTLTVEALR